MTSLSSLTSKRIPTESQNTSEAWELIVEKTRDPYSCGVIAQTHVVNGSHAGCLCGLYGRARATCAANPDGNRSD
jgi:hypothetical protein